MNYRQEISTGLRQLGLNNPVELVDRFELFINELIKWNRSYNLVGRRDESVIVGRHLLDSLSIKPYIWGNRVADVGSGGGFPGIPLAIYLPDTHFTLIDSNGKKTRFLEQVKMRLGLNNCDVIQTRAEALDATFNQITCRAFASLADTIQKTAHLLSREGEILALKGRLKPEETDVSLIPFQIRKIHKLKVPFTALERHLVVMGKKIKEP